MNQPTLRLLPTRIVTPETFHPFGQVIFPSQDGATYSDQDAQLELSQGIPRFYLMRLHARGRQFHQITRHRQCTQCLGALAGASWLLAVAPPSDTAQPEPQSIQAFQIPGHCFIKLDVGTWHAGPYFEGESIDFYNLELSDTNLTDHQTCDLKLTYGLKFEISSRPTT